MPCLFGAHYQVPWSSVLSMEVCLAGLGTDTLRSWELDRVPGRLCQQLEIVECLFSHEKQDEGTQ